MICALPGCSNIVDRPYALYCCKQHTTKASNLRRAKAIPIHRPDRIEAAMQDAKELRDAVDRLSTHRDDEADLRYYNATGRWPDDSP